MRAPLLILASFFLAVVASGATAAAAQDPSVLTARAVAGLQQAAEGKCKDAGLADLRAEPRFRELPTGTKAAIYLGMAACGDVAERQKWLREATQLPDAPPLAWGLRFNDASDRDDIDDAIHCIEVIAEKGEPKSVLVDENAVFKVWRRVATDAPRRLRFLAALERVAWAPADPLQESDVLWRARALDLAQAGQIDNAARVAARIDHPLVLLTMKLDKRFEQVVARRPGQFDVVYAVYAALEANRKTLEGLPSDGRAAYRVIENLRLLGRSDEALAIAQAVLERPDVLAEGNDFRVWIEDRQAWALYDLGRPAEAIEVMRKASTRMDRGRPSLAQNLNLAILLNAVGRHEEALEALAVFEKNDRVGVNARVLVEAERVCAAEVLGRADALAKALAYTEAHEAESRTGRIKALICHNDLDGAAKALTAWLEDPVYRGGALIEISRFRPRPVPPFQASVAERFAKVRKSSSVLSAVAKAGHTEDIPLNGNLWRDFD